MPVPRQTRSGYPNPNQNPRAGLQYLQNSDQSPQARHQNPDEGLCGPRTLYHHLQTSDHNPQWDRLGTQSDQPTPSHADTAIEPTNPPHPNRDADGSRSLTLLPSPSDSSHPEQRAVSPSPEQHEQQQSLERQEQQRSPERRVQFPPQERRVQSPSSEPRVQPSSSKLREQPRAPKQREQFPSLEPSDRLPSPGRERLSFADRTRSPFTVPVRSPSPERDELPPPERERSPSSEQREQSPSLEQREQSRRPIVRLPTINFHAPLSLRTPPLAQPGSTPAIQGLEQAPRVRDVVMEFPNSRPLRRCVLCCNRPEGCPHLPFHSRRHPDRQPDPFHRPDSAVDLGPEPPQELFSHLHPKRLCVRCWNEPSACELCSACPPPEHQAGARGGVVVEVADWKDEWGATVQRLSRQWMERMVDLRGKQWDVDWDATVQELCRKWLERMLAHMTRIRREGKEGLAGL